MSGGAPAGDFTCRCERFCDVFSRQAVRLSVGENAAQTAKSMSNLEKSWSKRISTWIAAGLCFGVATSVAIAWIQGWEGIPLGLNIDDITDVEGDALPDDLHGGVIREANRVTVILARGSQFYSRLDYEFVGPPAPPQPKPLPGWARLPPESRPAAATDSDYWRVATRTSGFGWPTVCLCAVDTRQQVHGASAMATRSRGASQVLRRFGVFATSSFLDEHADRVLPLLPYWPGLLADAAFWGLPVPLITLSVSALRRARRRRRGRCIGCGYDLSGCGAVCPECGQRRAPPPQVEAASSKA